MILSRIFALSLLMLTACSQPPDTHILRMGLANAPLNLDPRFATDAASERINRLLYQRLVEFDDQSLPVAGIADWETLSPTHYRFRLRQPTSRFTHEKLLDAADVVATYQFVLDPQNASPHRSALELIEDVTQVDQQTLDFHLKRSDPLFPAYLVLAIQPADLLASRHPFHEQPVGSGPFRFVDHPKPGHLLLERHRDGQKVEFIEVKNPTVRTLKLLRGEIDLLQNNLAPELVGYLRSRKEVEVANRPGSNFSYIGFNMEDPATGNPLVRRAIAHAIDRETIISQVLNSAAHPALALFPSEHWAGAKDLESYDYSPQLARSLLAEAGYDAGHPLKLVYKTSSDPFRIRLATIIQSQLKQVGIEVDLRSYDWGTFFGDIKAGRFQIYSLAWVGIRTPDIFRYIFASDSLPPKGANRGRYSSPEVDRLLKEVEQAKTLAEQANFYRQLQAILQQDLPYIPLWYEDQLFAARRTVTGYQLMTDGNYDGLEQVVLMNKREIPDAETNAAY
ncbi:MAG: ABC transporter substrate-binding protein [gamma proteobacterium endosymbiont of Lamellibrachia anaximandri]|nr:ABC transporter substrate-binding protein [gamma proteobacterium endosymbiont of Lamellibrachia anaximandri]MBL3617949.1 ABC transporter substrate-binding protein [gamma proteobacterium endosymbiont of Lamellibrachia anaximandri]